MENSFEIIEKKVCDFTQKRDQQDIDDIIHANIID